MVFLVNKPYIGWNLLHGYVCARFLNAFAWDLRYSGTWESISTTFQIGWILHYGCVCTRSLNVLVSDLRAKGDYQSYLMQIGSSFGQYLSRTCRPIASLRGFFGVFRDFQRALPLRNNGKLGNIFAVNRGDLALQYVPTTIQACVFALDRDQYTFLKPSKTFFAPDSLPNPIIITTAHKKKQNESLWVHLGAVPKRPAPDVIGCWSHLCPLTRFIRTSKKV